MRKKNKFVFDGQVYAQRLTGQYRYADEILLELDKIVPKDRFEIVVPAYVNISGKFKNIQVIQHGKVRGILWTQISLLWYLIKNHAYSIGFCNVTPLFKPGIAVVHDVGYKVLKTHYKNLYGRLSSAWHRLNYWIIAKSRMPVITVSEFSKKQIMEVYKVEPDRITVIGNGWQHYNRIVEDRVIFEEQKKIIPGKYYFALGSLEERKNFKWVVEVAKRNREEIFVIAGGAVRNAKDKLHFEETTNIIYLGHISDGQAKCLMKNCKAFLFPSTFEGFGIPPLEAMSVGTRVICADSSSLPEVCGAAVSYIDPYQYEINLSNEVGKERENAGVILQKYSWEKSAQRLLALLKEEILC